jgi:hypothetical protein
MSVAKGKADALLCPLSQLLVVLGYRQQIRRAPASVALSKHHRSHPRRTPAARSDRKQASGAFTSAAWLARATDRARLFAAAVKADRYRDAPRQPDLACGPVPAVLPHHIAALRYWNMAGQRYSRWWAPCHRLTPVSCRPRRLPHPAHPRGKTRLLGVGGRNPARHSLSAGGNSQERTRL